MTRRLRGMGQPKYVDGFEVRVHEDVLEDPLRFKQWGGTNKKRTGRTLSGRTWDEVPAAV